MALYLMQILIHPLGQLYTCRVSSFHSLNSNYCSITIILLIKSHLDYLKQYYQIETHWRANALGNRCYENDEDCVDHSVGDSTASNGAFTGEDATNTMVTGEGAGLQKDLDTTEQKNYQPSFMNVISTKRKR